MTEGDIQAVRNAREVLEKASHRLAEVMYQNVSPSDQAGGGGGDAGAASAGPTQDGQGAGSPGSGDGDVIDAEIVDSEEKK
jgi:hypothetical protein